MTKFDALKNQFQAALERLEEILAEKKSAIVRDAALKRFEFTFDLAWKVMRAYLQEAKGVDCSSPKDCIRAAYRQGLIEYDELWIKMTDWRNEIVHTYGEDYADKLYEKLPEVLSALRKFFSFLENNQNP